MKELHLIVASDPYGLVGVGQRLPWNVPEELRHFKDITTGGVVIMGRNTFLGLPKFPLPNRVNVVLSRGFVGVTREEVNGTPVYYAESFEVLDEALRDYEKHTWFVIGGPSLWNEALKTGRVSVIHQSYMNFVVPDPGKSGVYFNSIYDLVERGDIELELISQKEQVKFIYSELQVRYLSEPSTFKFKHSQANKVVTQ